MSHKLRWVLILLFLLGCQIASAPATFTPGPDGWSPGFGDSLPTVEPWRSPEPPDPTPSQEVREWECDSINGWILSPHCGLSPWFVAVNSNSDLISVISEPVRVRVEMPGGGSIYRDVFYPAPPTLYNWYFDTRGHDGVNIISGMPPIVTRTGNGFDMNITSLTGYAALRLEALELFTPPGRYVVGFEMTPRVSLPEISKNNPALITKQCIIRTDTGNRYELVLQNAGHNRYEATLDSAVYVITITQPLAIQLECGVHIAQPVFNGSIVWERIFVEPVPPEYGDTAITVK